MKNILLTFIISLFSISIFASGNHFHPKKFAKCKAKECTEKEIKDSLIPSVAYLSEWKKIDIAWAKATVEKVEKKQFAKSMEWMITLVNSTPEKKKQYVFFSLDGYVAGANTTGD